MKPAYFLLLSIVLLSAACGPTAASSPTAPAALSTSAPTAAPAASPSAAGNAANGQKLFAQLPCSSCHDVTKPYPGGGICPNLGNIAVEAARIVKSSDYHGKATDAPGYIRESIVDPNAYIVPGSAYHNPDGSSVMPKDFAQKLKPSEIEDLGAYLMTLK